MKTDIMKKVTEAAKKYKFMLIVIAAGLLLLLLPTGSDSGGDGGAAGEPDYDTFELAALERQISDALAQISGVGKTEVVLTLGSTMETVYQTDGREEEDADSSSRESETVFENAGSGVQTAVVRERIYPKFRGALIVCDGAASANVRFEVTRAVAALTGLSSDRITVLRRSTD